MAWINIYFSVKCYFPWYEFANLDRFHCTVDSAYNIHRYKGLIAAT